VFDWKKNNLFLFDVSDWKNADFENKQVLLEFSNFKGEL
jgi:hypothetical protein